MSQAFHQNCSNVFSIVVNFCSFQFINVDKLYPFCHDFAREASRLLRLNLISSGHTIAPMTNHGRLAEIQREQAARQKSSGNKGLWSKAVTHIFSAGDAKMISTLIHIPPFHSSTCIFPPVLIGMNIAKKNKLDGFFFERGKRNRSERTRISIVSITRIATDPCLLSMSIFFKFEIGASYVSRTPSLPPSPSPQGRSLSG